MQKRQATPAAATRCLRVWPLTQNNLIYLLNAFTIVAIKPAAIAARANHAQVRQNCLSASVIHGCHTPGELSRETGSPLITFSARLACGPLTITRKQVAGSQAGDNGMAHLTPAGPS
jgi:hypothetical protein